MFVDTGLLHSGATESFRAGEHAQGGARHLLRAALPAAMFGDFAAAEVFHDAVSSAHAQHVQTLQAHQEALGALGAKAHQAAAAFTDMDECNASTLRAVRWPASSA